MQIDEAQLKKYILESGLVSKTDFALAVELADVKKKKLGNILLSQGKISETDLKRMEAFVLGIPFISLTNHKVDFSVLSLIPEPIARNYNIVAYTKTDLKRMEAFVLGIPFISLTNHKVDFSVLSLIPEPIARNYNIVAYTKTDQGLEVAMLDGEDLPVIDFIKK